MKHRLRTTLGLGLSATMLMATPVLARDDDRSTASARAALSIPLPSSGGLFSGGALRAAIGDLLDSILGDRLGLPDPRPSKTVNVKNGTELRAAVQRANTSDGTIAISMRRGTYRLGAPGAGEDANASGDLDVTGDIVLLGNGSVIDLVGYGDRAFDVRSGGSLDVDDLSVVGAALPDTMSGGAFTNAGDLTLREVTLSNNTVSGAGASGGAVFNTGTLQIERSVLSGNAAARAGGAIETVNGTVSVSRTDLVANITGAAPGNGGAVHVSGTGPGTFTIDRSTVSGNVAAAEGGGLWSGAGSNVMTVTNTTIADNVANGGTFADPVFHGGGGLFNKGGTLVVTKSTITDNSAPVGSGSGGGILNLGTLEVSGTTIDANDAARAGGAIETVNGVVTIRDSALTDNVTGAAPGNGGGVHQSGTSGVATIDKTVVTGNVAALEGGGLWSGAGNSSMVVTRSTISGNTANGSTALNGGGGLFNKGGFLSVADSTVADNSAPVGSGSGGGIFNFGTLEVAGTDIDGNDAARAGGGIETVDGSITIRDSALTDNVTGAAPGNGGGVHQSGTAGVATIDKTVVSGNVAALEGGGLWSGAGNSSMVVTRSTITRNTANGSAVINGGGGLFNKGGFLSVTDSEISRNSAPVGSGSGGGILNLGTLEVSDTSITRNSAARAGGGLESNNVNGAGNATLVDVQLLANSTSPNPGNGGGVHITAPTSGGLPAITTLIDDSLVVGNSASLEGGGLWNFAGSTMTVTDTKIFGNRAPIAPNVFQNGAGGNFTVDGFLVEPGDNQLSFF